MKKIKMIKNKKKMMNIKREKTKKRWDKVEHKRKTQKTKEK